ncbi:unnamed protein product [Allacma fusca]|uniref:CCHC-type domain-containing protein n=1 Tax=Allacma fusca TaxID=39272 RepID=A0A8J2NUF7_9HEXA|nr:unnamed protein product [Allacma fusca]
MLSYLRSGKSVTRDDSESDDGSSSSKRSSGPFLGFEPESQSQQQSTVANSATINSKSGDLSESNQSSGDANAAGTSSSGSGEQADPIDPVLPSSNLPSGPPPPPPPGPSDDESEGSESSDDESDDVAVESDSSSSSSENMFGAGDNRVMESMVFRGTGFVSWKRKIKVILAAKGLQTAILEVNSLSPRKKAKALEILIRHVAENVFRLVKETEDPYVFWTELNSLYQAENQAAIIDCRTRISKIVIDMYKGPKEFLEAFYTLVNDMESLDVKLTPSETYTYLINALGNSPKYESVRMTARGLIHVTAGDPNPKLISSLLLSLEDTSKNSSTSKSSTSTGSAMAASDQSAKDRTCYKCHKRGHMAKSCRSAGGNFRNDTNPRGSIVCYRCNLTGHIGRNCPQNGDSSRNNGGNGSSSGTSGTSGTAGSSGSSGPRPSIALGLFPSTSGKKENFSLDEGRSRNIVDEFVKNSVGRSSFGDSVAISNFGNSRNVNIGSNYFLGDSTALNLGEENAYVETNDDDGVDFITFVVDSGATSHFLKHRGVLHDERKINESLQSAHCEVSLIKEGVGRLRVLADDGNVYWLNEVYYVPSLSFSLLSVSKIVANGYRFFFDEDPRLVDPAGNLVSRLVLNDNGLYTIQFMINIPPMLYSCSDYSSALISNDVSDSTNVGNASTTIGNDSGIGNSNVSSVGIGNTSTSSDSDVNLKNKKQINKLKGEGDIWHRRLAHTSKTVLDKIPELRGCDCPPFNQCQICCKAKQKKHTYDSSRYRYPNPLDLVHIDVMGPITEGLEGERYLIGFVDDCTRWGVTFGMRSKAEVGTYLKKYVNISETLWSTKVKRIRTVSRMRSSIMAPSSVFSEPSKKKCELCYTKAV